MAVKKSITMPNWIYDLLSDEQPPGVNFSEYFVELAMRGRATSKKHLNREESTLKQDIMGLSEPLVSTV